ncbi:MAG: dTMP kinase [Cohaesibacteraceae bacterium]
MAKRTAAGSNAPSVRKTLPGGLFITLEGGEGSGKSTQAKNLAAQLCEEGYDVIATHEPGGTPAGAVVREVLLSGHGADLGPLAEASLLTSARRDHVDHLIAPALLDGKIVVCDRFADSTRIYQGYVGGIPMHTIDQMEQVATDGLMPATTLVLDVDAETADERRKARLAVKQDADDRFEKEDASFHAKVRQGFRWLCKRFPDRCVLIDASGTPDKVSQAVRDAMRLRGLV